MDLPITEIQRFCMQDGPGVRTTVFFKGCPLRCQWCHNPETQRTGQEILFHTSSCIGCGACASVCPGGAQQVAPLRGFDRSSCHGCGACAEACPTGALTPAMRMLSLESVVKTVLRDRAFYGENGGVTLSGGEPMMHPEEALALLRRCREEGLHTAMETCGCFDPAYLPALARDCDILLWDFKDHDEERHLRYTGVSNQRILENLYAADALGAKIALHCIMVKGVNMEDSHYRAIARLTQELTGLCYVKLIPYHAYGGSKATLLGREDNGVTEWIPTAADMEAARGSLLALGVPQEKLRLGV